MVEPLRLDYAVNDSEVIAAFKRQQKELETERKARGELQKQITDNANAQKTADKAAFETSKMLSQQQAKLAADAAKIAEAVRTPMQQYKASLGELIDHYKSGRLTQDQYRAAVDRAKQSYQDQTGATERLKAAEVSENQEKREAAKLIEKLLTPQQKHAAAIKNISEMHKKGRLSIDQYNAALKAEGAELAKNTESGGGFSGMLGGLGGKLAGAAAGFMSIGAAITFVKNEYDALLERQGKSKDTNIDLAGAQSAALDNLDATMTPKDFAARMRKESKALGMNEKDLTVAASSALSAKGDKTASDAIDSVVASAKLNRFAPDQLPAMAGSALDLGKQLDMKPEEALGFLLQTQRTARTVSLKGVTENIAPGIISGVNMGLPKENAAAVAASISGTSVDPTGATTGTTMSSLFMQLREFGKKESGFTGGPEFEKAMAGLNANQGIEKQLHKERFDKASIALSRQLIPAGDEAELRRQLQAEEKKSSAELKARHDAQQTDLKNKAPELNAQQVLEKLQADPAMRDQFLKGKEQGGFGASFEKKMQTSVEQLLTPGTQGFKDYQNALKTQKASNPQQVFDETVKAKESMPAIQLAMKDQAMGNAVDQMRLADTKGAMSSIARTRLREMKDSMGKTSITSNLETVLADLDSGGVQSESGMIRKLEDLKHGAGRAQVPMLDKVTKEMREEGLNWEAPENKAEFLRRADKQVTQSPVGQQEVLLGILIEQLKGMRTDNANQAEQNKNKVHVGAMVGRAREAGK